MCVLCIMVGLIEIELDKYGRIDYLVNNGGGQFPCAAADMKFKVRVLIELNLIVFMKITYCIIISLSLLFTAISVYWLNSQLTEREPTISGLEHCDINDS